jgi:hypothetical protein
MTAALKNYIEVGECHEWQGAFDVQQPVIKLTKKPRTTLSVRREIWKGAGRPLNKGCVIFPSVCLNTACVRLEHMTEARHGEQLTAYAKAGKLRHTPATIARLTLAARSREATVLTMEKAREVRALAASGLSSVQVAQQTGLPRHSVSDILGGRIWRESVLVSSVFNWMPPPAVPSVDNSALRYRAKKAA